MYPFVAEIENYVDNKEQKEYFIGICKSYSDAADIIETRWSATLLSMKITLLEQDTGIDITEDTYMKILKGECP